MNNRLKSALVILPLLSYLCTQEARAQSATARSCPPVEIVFTMDTSGSMDDESQALCDTIQAVTQKLADKNIEASSVLWGISETGGGGFSCLSSHVVEELGDEVPGSPGSCGEGMLSGNSADNSENWGPATAVIAQRYPWSDDSVRVIVPISDEGPCLGDSCNESGADGEAIKNAIEIAKQNRVFVSPIVGTDAGDCTVSLATEIANKTGGSSFLSQDPNLDVAEAVTLLVEEACKTALACELSAKQRIYLPGSDARLQVAFSEDDAPAAGREVRIEVLEGPNAASQEQELTQNDGRAQLGYTSNGSKGVDRVQATCVDSSGREQKSATTELQFWDSDCDNNGIADQCDLSCDNFDGLCQEFAGCGQGEDQDADGTLDSCAVKVPTCGNGVLDCGEECDDGNSIDGDGCSAKCEVEPEDDCDDAFEDFVDAWARLLRRWFPWGAGCCGWGH